MQRLIFYFKRRNLKEERSNNIMKNFLILTLFVLLSGCVERDISKDLHNDIKGFNEFYTDNKIDKEKMVLYSAERKEKNSCLRKDVKVNEVTLKDVVMVLNKSFNSNIEVKVNEAGKGQFIVPFKNKEDFDRLLKLLSREA